MTARGDIRQHFEREAADYPVPPGLRASVTAEARRDLKVERRGMRLAAVVAVALAVAIVAGLIAAGSLRHLNQQPLPVVKPGQHGLVLAADSSGGSTGWALLGDCPGNDPTSQCAYWVETTQDGGRSWTQAVKVVTAPFMNGDTPRHIHFSDSRKGFVYGNGMAFATHDGGAHWSRIFASASGIVDIEGRGVAWAVIYPCGKGTQCAYQVERSTDGGRSWSPASALPAAFSARAAVAFGATGLIVSSFGAGDLAVTSDAGSSWRSVTGRCSPGALANAVASANGAEIWQYCAEPTGIADTLWVSEDGGSSWTRRTSLGVITTAPVLISPVPGTAFLLTSTASNVTAQLALSTDAGRSWHTLPGASAFTAIDFAQGAAWAVDDQFFVWSSNDGGMTWTKLPAQP